MDTINRPGDPARMQWQDRWETGDTPWDHGEAAPPLVDWLRDNTLTGRILVPGCGSGHEVRAVASAAGAEVLGLDLAEGAVAAADAFPEVGRERYRVGDFLALPEDLVGQFDALVEHTCFCAIDPADRPRYATAAARALKPGGRLVAIFYLDPQRPVGPPFGVERAELDALFAAGFALESAHVPTRVFPGREGREELRVYRRQD